MFQLIALKRKQLGIAAQTSKQQPIIPPPHEGEAAEHGVASETGIEKVTGIGGFFFRAHDPKGLGRWYQQRLGIALTPSSYEDSRLAAEAGPTVFDPTPETSNFFGDSQKVWMLNFRVRDIDRMVVQLRGAGIDVRVDRQSYSNGRFAHLHDPEANPIELWQSATPVTASFSSR